METRNVISSEYKITFNIALRRKKDVIKNTFALPG